MQKTFNEFIGKVGLLFLNLSDAQMIMSVKIQHDKSDELYTTEERYNLLAFYDKKPEPFGMMLNVSKAEVNEAIQSYKEKHSHFMLIEDSNGESLLINKKQIEMFLIKTGEPSKINPKFTKKEIHVALLNRQKTINVFGDLTKDEALNHMALLQSNMSLYGFVRFHELILLNTNSILNMTIRPHIKEAITLDKDKQKAPSDFMGNAQIQSFVIEFSTGLSTFLLQNTKGEMYEFNTKEAALLKLKELLLGLNTGIEIDAKTEAKEDSKIIIATK